MNLRPLHDQVFVEMLPDPAASSILHDPHIRQTPIVHHGIVLAVGRETKHGLRKGDEVLFKKGKGLDVSSRIGERGKTTLVMYEHHIEGVIER